MLKIPNKWYFLFYFFLIFLAEIITVFANPSIGIILHAIILCLLFIHSSIISKKKMSDNRLQWLFIKRNKNPSKLLQFFIGEKQKVSSFLLALTLIPMIRILSLVMPLPFFSRIQWFLVIAIPIYIACLVYIFQQKIDIRRYGLKLPDVKHVPIELGIIFLAVPFGYLEYSILQPDLMIGSLSFSSILFAVLIILIATGLMEEIIFRGILQNKSIDIIGPWYGILFVSLLFAILHIGNLSILDVILVFMIGFIYAIVVKTTKSIIGVSISHTVVNVFLFIVFPLSFA